MRIHTAKMGSTGTKKAAVRFLAVLLFTVWIGAGCESMDKVTDLGATLGVAAGMMDNSQADSLRKTGKAVAKSFQDITPEQEYYIGRTIGAVVLKKYAAFEKEDLNRYLNLIGQTLARASDRPETFGGYHFLVQDSEQINAFAAPGGLIFVTRGMLRCCRTEDALAAVLAHEIAHVEYKHGLQAIHKSRITNALAVIGMESAKTFGGQDLSELTRTFENSIADITRTLVDSGYSRAFEREADQGAVRLLERVGYNPHALQDMLQIMSERLEPGGIDFAATHPSPQDRISEIRRIIDPRHPTEVNPPNLRQERFVRNVTDN